MTLQQLKYVDAVATCGSLSEAARRLFVTQPTLTESIHSLEEELRTAIFVRSPRGMVVTREGEELLSSVRQVLADVSLIHEKYSGKSVKLPQFSVSSQHYAFAVQAFIDVLKEETGGAYDFTIRETSTSDIFEDVVNRRSEVGVIFLSRRNSAMLEGLIRREKLQFVELFASVPHVIVKKGHPLARRSVVRMDELDDYPFVSFQQDRGNALCFSEEVMPSIERKKNIRVCDRATMMDLISRLDGFAIASPAVSRGVIFPDFVSVPLDCDDEIRVGVVFRSDRALSPTAKKFVDSAKVWTRTFVKAGGK